MTIRRTPLPRRRTPIARSTKPIARSRPNQKRATARRSSRVIDEPYLAIVRTMQCRVAVTMPDATECRGRIDPDHMGRKPGMSVKADDVSAVPLCRRHHDDRHDFTGPFKGWDRARMWAWRREQIAATQAVVFARLGRE